MTAWKPCAALILALAAVLPGCDLPKILFEPRIRECEGFDVPLAALAVSSRKELRVRVLSRRVEQEFPFVVESSADSFVLTATAPDGGKGFTLERRGDSVKIDNQLGPVLPVPPRLLMADVLAMSVPSACGTAPDGIATSTAGTWQIADTCKDARPLQRHITRPNGPEELEIDYDVDAIVVHQYHCRYNARYVLQGPAAPAPISTIVDAGEDGEK